jgi:condensin complex subunit 2
LHLTRSAVALPCFARPQRASCTLDASVKIYSYRVDAVHKDTYKVLGGLNHVDTSAFDGDGADGDDADADGDAANDDKKQAKKQKKESSKKGVSTLETKLSNINCKKVDSECEVDPLFHKTSSSFDEGQSVVVGRCAVCLCV